MTDLVTRLRECSDEFFREDPRKYIGNLLREAADALEKANSHLLDAANNCVRQDTLIGSLYSKRDALKAKLAGNKAFQCAQACDPAMIEIERLNRETHRLSDRAEKAEASRDELLQKQGGLLSKIDEARAEAAAYRHMLKIALGCIDFDENRATVKEICEALSQPGPGAALLERVKKLEAVAEVAKRDAGRDGAGVSWEMTEALKALWRESRDT